MNSQKHLVLVWQHHIKTTEPVCFGLTGGQDTPVKQCKESEYASAQVINIKETPK